MTNLRHQIVKLEDLERLVLLHLDGTVHQKELVDLLFDPVEQALLAQGACEKPDDREDRQERVAQAIAEGLRGLARKALLKRAT